MWCPIFKPIPEVVLEIFSPKYFPNNARNDEVGKGGNFDFV